MENSALWKQAVREGAVSGSLASVLSTCALAAVVDYQLIPKRLTPGYEHRVSIGAMVAIYAALAAGFALGAVALQKRS
jgi:hypothetical protein